MPFIFELEHSTVRLCPSCRLPNSLIRRSKGRAEWREGDTPCRRSSSRSGACRTSTMVRRTPPPPPPMPSLPTLSPPAAPMPPAVAQIPQLRPPPKMAAPPAARRPLRPPQPASAASGPRCRPRRAAEIGNYHYGQGHPMKVRPSFVCLPLSPLSARRSLLRRPRVTARRSRAACCDRRAAPRRAELASVRRVLTHPRDSPTPRLRPNFSAPPRSAAHPATAMMVADRSWTFCWMAASDRPRDSSDTARSTRRRCSLVAAARSSRARVLPLSPTRTIGSRTAYA